MRLCVHLWPLDAQTTWQEKEKWRWTQGKMTGKRWDDRRMRCVCLFESWNLGPETEVMKPRSWNPGLEVQVLKSRSDRLPKVNTRVFFFRPFFGGLPRVNTRVFFFRPFPAGSLCRRQTCPGLIPGFFFSPPFFGGLPRVNTRVFFSLPFSGGLPRVNTRVFFFFFSRPFPAGRRSRVPTSLF